MREIIILSLVAFNTFSMAAQGGFSIFEDLQTQAYYYDAVYQEPYVVAGGGILHPDTFLIGAVYVKYDTLGNQINTGAYYDPDNYNLSFKQSYPMLLNSEGKTMMMGDILGKATDVIILWNENGTVDEVWEYPYQDNAFTNFTYDIIEIDQGYLLARSRNINYEINTVITKLSLTGEVEWEKTYGIPNSADAPGSILQISPNEFVVGGYRETTQLSGYNQNYICRQNRLFGIDSTGIMQWQYFGEPCSTENVHGLQQTEDGGYVFSTVEVALFDPWIIGWQPKIVRLDADRNLLWELPFTDTYSPSPQQHYFYNIRKLDNGTYLSGGQLILPEPYFPSNTPTDTYRAACFFNFTDSGDSLYRSCVPAPEFSTQGQIGGLVTLPSGSSIAVGTFTENTGNGGKSWAWVVKVDAQGCLEPDCNVVGTALPPRDEGGVRVFPNPARGDLQIEFSQPATGNLELLSAIGQVVRRRELLSQRQHSLPVADLPRGIYFLRVTDGGGQLLHLENVVLR